MSLHSLSSVSPSVARLSRSRVGSYARGYVELNVAAAIKASICRLRSCCHCNLDSNTPVSAQLFQHSVLSQWIYSFAKGIQIDTILQSVRDIGDMHKLCFDLFILFFSRRFPCPSYLIFLSSLDVSLYSLVFFLALYSWYESL